MGDKVVEKQRGRGRGARGRCGLSENEERNVGAEEEEVGSKLVN